MIEQIKKVLVDALNIDEETITPEANLKDDLGIDSLAAVELALELETEFDIRIEDEELAKLETVQDIINIIEEKHRKMHRCSAEKIQRHPCKNQSKRKQYLPLQILFREKQSVPLWSERFMRRQAKLRNRSLRLAQR